MRGREGGRDVFRESSLACELVGHDYGDGEIGCEGVGEELGIGEVDAMAFC